MKKSAIGKLLQDRYHLTSKIGSGGMGTIYLAHDTLLERDVAIKVLSNPNLRDTGKTRLIREAQAAAKLNHPHIVSLHDIGYHKDIPFIVMELVDGNSVQKDKPTHTDEILRLARQICSALEHAHENGIVHRDLKPANIIITPDGAAKLTDFGLARSISSRMTVEGTVEGTVFYMAPEQALGKPTDHRTDLYSLGILLYELTTGQLPFFSDELLQVISQHLYALVIPPRAHNPEIPQKLENLILQLLSKEPEDRPQTAAEVLQLLDGCEEVADEIEPTKEFSPIDRIIHGRLVGRKQEFAEASNLWRCSVAKESHVLLISGEPGVGKSRFVRELKTLAEIERGRVLVSTCYAEGSMPYSPLAQILRQVLKDDAEKPIFIPDFYLANLLPIVPDLRPRFPALPQTPHLNPQVEQDQILDSVVGLFGSLTDQAPLLLIVEDAHWADSSTLYLLRNLVRRSRTSNSPLLLILTYREDELDESRALNGVIYDLNRERLASHIKLSRLNHEETYELISVMFQNEISPEFVNGIYKTTEGNPFFIEEVCKALIEEGKLFRDNERWCCSNIDEIEIPQSVRMAVQIRIRKLSSMAQDVLKLAAILGREFNYEIMKELSGLDEDPLIDALEEAESSKLIVETKAHTNGRGISSTTFVFTNVLIPTTILESISSLRKRQLHRRAAAALERIYPDQYDQFAPRLGYHFAEAGDGSKAAKYLLMSGDSARNLYAYQEAIDAYQQSLNYLQAKGDLERAARTYMKLGLIHHNRFEFQQSRLAYNEGFSLWQRFGEALAEVLPSTTQAFRTIWPNVLTLDPGKSFDAYSNGIITQLFRGLVYLNPSMNIVPDIAQSWEILEDGRKYIFHLRDDVLWNDKTPLTAYDFEYGWKRVLDPSTGSESAKLLYIVKGAETHHLGESSSPIEIGIQAIDDYTLIVELEQPAAYFLYLLSTPISFPVPRHAVKAYGSDWANAYKIITCGPFKIKDWNTDEKLILSKNEEYSGRWRGNINNIELTMQSETLAYMDLYENDELDVLNLGALEALEAKSAIYRHAGQFISVPGPSISFIGFNTDVPPFNDLRIRQAFTHAIDKEIFAEVILHRRVIPATGGFIPPGIPGHSEGIGLSYDPEIAKELLAEAGYPNGQGFPPIEFILPVSPVSKSRAEFLQRQWKENLNVSVTWDSLSLSDLFEKISQEKTQMFNIAWMASLPDPNEFLRIDLNHDLLQWKNSEFEDYLLVAGQTHDETQRMILYEKADRLLIQNAAVIPLSYGEHQFLMKPWIKRFPISPLCHCFWKDIVIETY